VNHTDRQVLQTAYDKEVAAAVERLQTGAPAEQIEESLRRIQIYSKLLAEAKPGAWRKRLVAAVTAVICLVIGGLLWSLKLSDLRIPTPIRLELQTSSVQFDIADPFSMTPALDVGERNGQQDEVRIQNATDVFLPKGTIEKPTWVIVRADHVQLSKLDLVRQSHIEFTEDGGWAQVLLTGDGNKCEISFSGNALLEAGSDSNGVQVKVPFNTKGLVESVGVNADGRDAKPTEIRIRPASFWPVENAKVHHLSFFQVRSTGPGEQYFESAIKKGTVTLLDIASSENLEERDNLSLEGLESKRFKIWSDGNLQVQIEGTVKKIAAGPEGFEKNLSPSLLQFMREQKPMTFFWSAVLFLWGLLWGAKKTLFD
jgi:hypothetical protein